MTSNTRRPRRRAIFLATTALALTGAAVTAVPAFAWDEIVRVVVNCDGRYVEYTNTEKSRSVDVNIKGVVGAEKISVAPGQTVKILIPANAVPGSTIYIEQRWTDGSNGYDKVPVTVPDFASAATCAPPPVVIVTPTPTPSPVQTPAIVVPVVTPVASCPLVASRISGLATRIKVGNTDLFQLRLSNSGTTLAKLTVSIRTSGAAKLISSPNRVVTLAPGGKKVVNMQVRAIKAGTGTIRVSFGSNGLKCGSLGDKFTGFVVVTTPPVVPYTP